MAVEEAEEVESRNYPQRTATHLRTTAALWEDLHSLHLVTTIRKRGCTTTVEQTFKTSHITIQTEFNL